MKFINLNSENSYLHKNFIPVSIEIRRQSLYWDELKAQFTDFELNDIVLAGWLNTPTKAFKSEVINIKEIQNDFEDERTWKVTVIRIN